MDKMRSNRCGYQRACTETTYCNAGDQSSSIGKPLDEYGDRNDIAKAYADAANDPIGEVE